MTEHQLQVSIIQWARWQQAQAHPDLRLLFAVPNGGKRDIGVARKMKSEGLASGVPDLVLPIARGKYHGLWIELKVGRNKPTPRQLWWHSNLKTQGHKVVVCYDFDEAIAEIEGYLKTDAAT